MRWVGVFVMGLVGGLGLGLGRGVGSLVGLAFGLGEDALLLCQKHGLYSSVVERQSCKLKVLGSIPSGGCRGGLLFLKACLALPRAPKTMLFFVWRLKLLFGQQANIEIRAKGGDATLLDALP